MTAVQGFFVSSPVFQTVEVNTEEQIVDVPAFRFQEDSVEVMMEKQIVKAVHLKAQEPVENCTKEQFVEETVPQCQAETRKLSHCRAQEPVNFRTVEQIVDVSVLWSQEETVDVSTVRTQGRISESNFECHKCWSLSSW